jgi:hypothetical protein
MQKQTAWLEESLLFLPDICWEYKSLFKHQIKKKNSFRELQIKELQWDILLNCYRHSQSL